MAERITPYGLVFVMAQLLFAAHLFARQQPRRDDFVVRLWASSAAGLVIALGIWWVAFSWLAPSSQAAFASTEFAVFCLFFGVLVVCVSQCYATSVWNVLFCCAAGYTVQNLSSGMDGAILLIVHASGVDVGNLAVSVASIAASTVVVYLVCFLAFVQPMEQNGVVDVQNRSTLLLVAAVILVDICFDMTNKILPGFGVPLPMLLALRTGHGVACVLTLVVEFEMLYNRQLRGEMTAFSRMMQEEEKQYRLSKESIEAINIKCHDLKHQIRHLHGYDGSADAEALRDLEREVGIYDAAVKTGNDALDVILTEKGLLCEHEGIDLSCIADGSGVAFMTPADIYSLFGNALDNAIEAERGLDASDKRSISLNVRRSADLALIHVENYFSGTLAFKDGLPKTTKSDVANHGFGTKSMQLIAQRYGGTLTTRTQGEVFCLDVMLPIPE